MDQWIKEVLTREDEGAEITLSGLLGDASQCLTDHGKPELAKAVKVARALVGEGASGEAWCKDIMNVLERAAEVVETARHGESVDLSDLRDATVRCAEWGMKVEDRLANALSTVINGLAHAQVHLNDGAPERAEEIVNRILSALVIDSE